MGLVGVPPIVAQDVLHETLNAFLIAGFQPHENLALGQEQPEQFLLLQS
jgi:hypothetical protein